MKYNLENVKEADEAFEYLTKLSGQESFVEIKKINPKRSLNQNAYLHLTFGIFSLETGYTLEESKTIYKREANPAIYVYSKQIAYRGGTREVKFLKSSADLDTLEMTITIDKWREYAAENGVHIPPPENLDELRSLENEIDKQSFYIRR